VSSGGSDAPHLIRGLGLVQSTALNVANMVGIGPFITLLSIGALTAGCCFLSLEQVITAAVTVRIIIQFVGQIVALHVLRTSRPDVALPFRMWAYPLPSLIALVGWLFLTGTSGLWMLAGALGVIASGCLAFVLWNVWPRPH